MEDKRRKEPDEGPNGIDRWASNGYGITIGGKKVKPIDSEEREEDVDKIDEV